MSDREFIHSAQDAIEKRDDLLAHLRAQLHIADKDNAALRADLLAARELLREAREEIEERDIVNHNNSSVPSDGPRKTPEIVDCIDAWLKWRR